MPDAEPVKESKAQRIERLKREKLAWDHLDEIRAFARTGRASVPPEWLGTYFRSWGIYAQGDGVGVVGGANGEGKSTEYFMVRIGITNGIRRSDQFRTLAELSEKHAQGLADIIGVIRRGRVIAKGTFAELSQRFVGNPIMEIEFVKPLNGVAKDLAGLVEITETGENWLRFSTPEPRTTNPAVLRRLSEHGVEVITLSQVKQSLEEVYLQIVEEDEKAQGRN